MGEHHVEQQVDDNKAHAFMKALLEDLRALAFMLQDGRVESGVTRIGAEQEMFLIDPYLRPAPVSLEVLKHAKDSRLTTEIARFNLEANLTPLRLETNCFTRMELELTEVLEIARKSAATQNADVLLAGILPTLHKSDLTLDNLAPVARYHELNRGVIRLRGGPLSIEDLPGRRAMRGEADDAGGARRKGGGGIVLAAHELDDLEGHLQRGRVPPLLDGDDGLPGHPDAVGQLRLRHLAVGEAQRPDRVGDPGRLAHGYQPRR